MSDPKNPHDEYAVRVTGAEHDHLRGLATREYKCKASALLQELIAALEDMHSNMNRASSSLDELPNRQEFRVLMNLADAMDVDHVTRSEALAAWAIHVKLGGA